MELSWDILLAFNSILDGKRIRGIRFNSIKPESEEVFVKETVGKMIKSGLVKESGELTETGEMIRYVLNQYKTAQTVVFINRIRIGVVKGNICPALIPTYEEGQLSKVDVRIVHKEIIFLALIEGYPILRQGHMGSIAKYPDLYEVKSKIINHDLNETLFLAKECTGHNENYICLIDSDRIQKIDLIKESVSVVGGGDIRHDIACMLGLTWM